MLVDLIQERSTPTMRSYFFRRMYTELEGGGGAIDQAYQLFSQTSGTYNAASHTWRWPSGAEFYFRHCKDEKTVYHYQGHAITALAIDESTHWPMDMIRYLISRNRSTDRGLKIRTRLGTNPGNVGHKDHMKVFFPDKTRWPKEAVGICPHCEPHKSFAPGELRWDAKWHDGRPMEVELDNGEKVRLSVSYILSNIRDHSLLGNSYLVNLRMQSAATAKALEEGCWRIFEGQYFDCWDYNRCTVPIQLVPVEWWWPHWTGTDYGYKGSAAASGLFTISPEGVIYLLQEYPSGDVQGARRVNAKDFARGYYDALIKHKPGSYEQPMRLEEMYIGRDTDAERGADHTLLQLMHEELEPEGLTFSKVADDRSGAAQLTYIKLAYDGFKVCRNCRNTIDALETRLHDPDEPMKTLKDPGSHLDDYMDMVFHGIYGYLEAGKKPVDERVKERMKAIVETKDPMALTSAAIKYRQIQKAVEEEEGGDENEAVYVGRNARARIRQMESQNRRY